MEQLQINDDCLFIISKILHTLRTNDINKELENWIFYLKFILC